MLTSVKEELSIPSTEEFWEVTERGTNFSYLEPELISQLDKLFQFFPALKNQDRDDFWKTQAGISLRVQQELTDFDCRLTDSESDSEEDYSESDSEEIEERKGKKKRKSGAETDENGDDDGNSDSHAHKKIANKGNVA